MTAELSTIIDFIRYGASRFGAAGLTFSHSYDNALDEATHLVLQTLHLPHDLCPVYAQARLTGEEKATMLALFERGASKERIPAAYLTGEAWFAGLPFKSDPRALVPRSPIAELIENVFRALAGRAARCSARSTCAPAAVASASPWPSHNPDWQVDLVDISEAALQLAAAELRQSRRARTCA
jgi:ribosomal protein L3 glutamine methyltransferase